MESIVREIRAIAGAIFASLFILVLDYLPKFIKKKRLEGEYTGEALEKRLDVKIFGGWKMFKKILEINRSEATLKTGDTLPADLKIIDTDAQLKELVFSDLS
ncbi:unnamed protein product [Oikopleura dioica]|uniref:Uncharacterized protein n=1 Tax=Oikopleura dioica TaxID=34765 RepID=E4Z4V7_OIKDI|nr:unnamed protein product [Oikopleura dioica]